MASTFTGWGNSWADTWGAGVTAPGALSGAAPVQLGATGTLTAIGHIAGSASLSLAASGTITDANAPPVSPIAPAGRAPRRGEWPAWLNLPHTPHFAPEPTPPKARRRDTDDDLLMIL